MRNLTSEEMRLVAGGEGEEVCTANDLTNDYMGIQDTTTLGEDLINIYEGVVEATSYVIERIANSFGS